MSDFESSYKDLLSTFNLVGSSKGNERTGHGAPPETGNREPTADVSGPTDGIIFTDTQVLAEKFSLSEYEVLSSIKHYITASKQRGFEWALLDMSDNSNRQFLTIDKSPYSYHKALNAFTSRRNWKTDAETCLFIIGGNDVIPVKQSVDSLDFQEFLTDEDIYYCFPSGFDFQEEIEMIVTEESAPEDISNYLLSKALFNVSRLPLDAPKVKEGFANTIGNYFERAISSNWQIPVKYVMVTTAKQWEKESDFVANGLPLVPTNDYPGLIKNGVFQSPEVDLDNPSTLREYYNTMRGADLLLFNLHGAPDYNVSSYFGDNGNPCNHFQPRAFDIESLEYSSGRVINSMACFGAKYLNIGRSLLKSSIYQDVLLFAGSSNFAWGRQSNDFPCGCSEIFLRFYTEYLMSDFPAGLAFLTAKIDYLAAFLAIDGFDKAYFTVREFNLFGDPSISCICNQKPKTIAKPKYSVSPRPWFKGAIHNAYGITAQSALDEVYEQVRDAVDANLEEIAIKLGHRIYNDLGYNDVKISKIDKIKSKNKHSGYRFTYSVDQHFYRGAVEINTDLEGEPSSIFYTK